MAYTILNLDPRVFAINNIEFNAALQFSIEMNGKLVPYNYIFSSGIDYDYINEGEVRINLKIIMQSWDNIGNDRGNDLNQLRWFLISQKDNNPKTFVHPEMPPMNIFIDKVSINQDNIDRGFTIDISCVKVTRNKNIIQETQEQVESNLESRIDDGEFIYEVQAGDTLSAIANEYLGDPKLYQKLWEYEDNSHRNESNSTRSIYTDIPLGTSISDMLAKVDVLTLASGPVKYVNAEEKVYIDGIIAGSIVPSDVKVNDPNYIVPGWTFKIPKTLS